MSMLTMANRMGLDSVETRFPDHVRPGYCLLLLKLQHIARRFLEPLQCTLGPPAAVQDVEITQRLQRVVA